MAEQINTLQNPPVAIGQRPAPRIWMWTFGLTIAGSIVVGFSLGVLAVIASDGELNPFTHLFFLPFGTAVYGFIGLLIMQRHPQNALGWLLGLVGVFSGLTLLVSAYSQFDHYALTQDGGGLSDLCAWLDKWIWVIPSIVPLTTILLLFPDGQLPSARWRWVSWVTGAGISSLIFGAAFHPGPLPEFGLAEVNPYGITGLEPVLEPLLSLAGLWLVLGVLGSLAAVAVRYCGTTGIVRVQLKWLVYTAGLVVIALLLSSLLWLTDPDNPHILELSIMINSGGVTLIIMAIGIAILRHQLWDVDILINRTLVYGLLTALVAGMYVLIVSFLSVLFAGDHVLFSLVATGVVAASFQPLRGVIQYHINRLLFGERDEPYKVLQRLAEQLAPVIQADKLLPGIVEAVADALRLPYVAITLAHEGRYTLVAVYPLAKTDQRPAGVTLFPLIYQAETIGQLIVAPRSADEAFTPAEQQLMETIARQVAIATYNVRLTNDLQRSREQLVTTREEERRRLRRDLHDGLGPVLASMSFRLDAIHNIADRDHQQVRALVTDLKTQVQSSLADIRRIAYNLRPPALDELGLIGALREHSESARHHDNLCYVLEVPESLPPLPAAVEVAAYRIIMEAMTNAQRHAYANTCVIRIAPDEGAQQLCLDVIDDGRGLSRRQATGVGLTAMRERALELGGHFSIESPPASGTHVQAKLPLA